MFEEHKAFLKRLATFLAPVVLLVLTWQAVELFVLPISTFTSRVYETLVGTKVIPEYQLGKFYPNQHVAMWESGDKEGFRWSRKGKKFNEWFTDSYGFRNRPRSSPIARYDIVVTGDSMIAGSFLDQGDTLPEVLEKLCSCATYNFGSMNERDRYLADPRFRKAPPKLAIFETQLSYMNVEPNPWTPRSTEQFATKDPEVSTDLLVLLDRLYKQPFYRWLRSRLNTVRDRPPNWNRRLRGKELLKSNFESIIRMRDILRAHGTEMMLLLLPTKDRSLDRLPPMLEEAGLPVVWFPPTAEHPHGADFEWFFHKVDTHWREPAVRHVARLIVDKMKVWYPDKIAAVPQE